MNVDDFSLVSNNFCIDVINKETSVYKQLGYWKSFRLFGENSCNNNKNIYVLHNSVHHNRLNAQENCMKEFGIMEYTNITRTTYVSNQPPYKYCRNFYTNIQTCKRHCNGEKPLAVILPELHANLNIGHSVKDIIFLAHILTIKRPNMIIVDDKASSTGYINQHNALKYRKHILNALVPDIPILFSQENANKNFNNYTKNMCFKKVIQKPIAFTGSNAGSNLLRNKIYKMCKIKNIKHKYILFADHGKALDKIHSRQFKEKERILKSLKVLESFCPSRKCKIISSSFSDNSFCAQANLYSKSKIVIAHHGANIANSVFLSPKSIVIEINKECDNTYFANSGYAQLHASLGIAYIGARVSYMKEGRYDFRSNSYIYLNFKKWNNTLEKAQELLGRIF